MLNSTSPYQNTVNGYVYATPNTGTITAAAWTNPSPAVAIEQSGVVQLTGEKADVVINGISLTETLKTIQDRLNVLRPNTALEAEWDQLRDLGLQYRKLEAELKEKQRAWEILRKSEG